MQPISLPILLRGGGDLASGVALRLHRAGLRLAIAELAQPLAVRRAVSFAEAVFEGEHTVEGVTGRLVKRDQVSHKGMISAALKSGEIPVLIDADADILSLLPFLIVIDARLIKQPPAPLPSPVPLHIGLGPGFHAGVNCDAVIETRRSHTLGRVYWQGTTQADSGQPEGDPRRVLRSPSDGVLVAARTIGQHVEEGEVIARINDQYPVFSEIKGVVRGIIRNGSAVTRGLKIGDVDPRDNEGACYLVSDKALAIGGGVLEAILHRKEIRERLWG